VTLVDAAGLLGVALMFGAYAASHLGDLNPKGPTSLVMNLSGAVLVLLSLLRAFNLPAFVMEALWAVVAAIGLIRWFVDWLKLRRLKAFLGH
jgi:hypothetical protein